MTQFQVCREHQLATAIPALKFCMVGGERYQTVELTIDEYEKLLREGENRWGTGFEKAPANFNQVSGEAVSALPGIEM